MVEGPKTRSVRLLHIGVTLALTVDVRTMVLALNRCSARLQVAVVTASEVVPLVRPRPSLGVGALLGVLVAVPAVPPLLHVGALGPLHAAAPSLPLTLLVFADKTDSCFVPCCYILRVFVPALAPFGHNAVACHVDHVAVAMPTGFHMQQTRFLAGMRGFEALLPCAAILLHIVALFAS